MNRNRKAVIAALILVVAAGSASAAAPDLKRLPGYIDGSAFAEIADESAEVVEVNLSGALLRALGNSKDPQKDADSIFRQLQSIQAYIVTVGTDPVRIERADALVRDIEAKLRSREWERMARVREKEERIGVFVHYNEAKVDGLTIVMSDKSEGEVVFVNIVGDIDLARLGEVGEQLDLPGLDAVPVKEGAPKAPSAPKRPAGDPE